MLSEDNLTNNDEGVVDGVWKKNFNVETFDLFFDQIGFLGEIINQMLGWRRKAIMIIDDDIRNETDIIHEVDLIFGKRSNVIEKKICLHAERKW